MDDEKKAAGRDDRPPPSRGRPARGRAFRILQVRLELLYALHDAPRGKARRLVARPSRVVVWPSALTNARGGGHHSPRRQRPFFLTNTTTGAGFKSRNPRPRPAPQRRRANAPMSGVFDGDEEHLDPARCGGSTRASPPPARENPTRHPSLASADPPVPIPDPRAAPTGGGAGGVSPVHGRRLRPRADVERIPEARGRRWTRQVRRPDPPIPRPARLSRSPRHRTVPSLLSPEGGTHE